MSTAERLLRSPLAWHPDVRRHCYSWRLLVLDCDERGHPYSVRNGRCAMCGV
jgi:hypothetical protein